MAQVDNKWITLGKIGRAHGLKGEVFVQSYTEPTTNIESYSPIYILINNEWRPVKLEKLRANGDKIVIQLDISKSRSRAESLTHCLLGIPKDQLPKLNNPSEFYWADLIGLKVFTSEQVALGTVIEMMETGSNDVIVIKGKDKKHLVPFILEEYVLGIDLEQQKIIVDWDPEF